MLGWLFGTRQKPSEADQLPPYEESRSIAARGSVEKRRWLASRKGLQPEILYYFASDDEPGVRKAVAANETTPLQADKILSTDDDEDVRAELAHKISRLLPGINSSGADKVSQMVLGIVRVLAEDKATRIRAIVSEEIKSLSNVPNDLIRQLAWDAESIVAMPVLEYSPLLSDRHLLEIIRSGIDGGALASIARRKNLSEDLADGVVGQNVNQATIDLLKNKTATISAKSFEVIGSSAENDFDILDNLIEREDLTLATIRRVAGFVGNAVLSRIIERHKHRPDFKEEDFSDIRQKIAQRITKGDAEVTAIPGEEARLRAEELYSDDKLNEGSIIKAIDEEDRMFVFHALALLSTISWRGVRDILNTKIAKTIAALAWKAGISAEKSVYLQSNFCSVGKFDLIYPNRDGEYVLSEDDMEWYLDSFS